MVAYLDSITVQALTIDLITVKVYEVNGAQIALPQRVSPDIAVMTPAPNPAKPKAKGIMSDGVDAFRASIEDAAGEARKTFDELIARAEEWASLPNVRVRSYASIRPGEYTLLPKIMPDNAGLVTIWNDNLQPSIAFWRSVFERRAPKSLEAVERVMGPLKIGKWKSTKDITPELIDAITKAYEEANDG